MRPAVRTRLRWLGAAGLAATTLVCLTPLPNVLARQVAARAEAGTADAVVVLGAGTDPGGRLSDPSLRRAVHAIALFRQGRAPRLVIMGGDLMGVSEAEARARLARDMGVAAASLLLDTGARTTRDEAARLRARLQPLGVRRILLVTGSLHMPRARRTFERAGFEVLAEPVEDVASSALGPLDRLDLALAVLKEAVARAYYRAAGAW